MKLKSKYDCENISNCDHSKPRKKKWNKINPGQGTKWAYSFLDVHFLGSAFVPVSFLYAG